MAPFAKGSRAMGTTRRIALDKMYKTPPVPYMEEANLVNFVNGHFDASLEASAFNAPPRVITATLRVPALDTHGGIFVREGRKQVEECVDENAALPKLVPRRQRRRIKGRMLYLRLANLLLDAC